VDVTSASKKTPDKSPSAIAVVFAIVMSLQVQGGEAVAAAVKRKITKA
jgi:hypothetical protein